MDRTPLVLTLIGRLLSIVAYILPEVQRDEWKREWFAELWWYWQEGPKHSKARFSLNGLWCRELHGCIIDAILIRWNSRGSHVSLRQISLGFWMWPVLAIACVLLQSSFSNRSVLPAMLSPLPHKDIGELAVVTLRRQVDGVLVGFPRKLALKWKQTSKLLSTVAGCSQIRKESLIIDHSHYQAEFVSSTSNLFTVLGAPKPMPTSEIPRIGRPVVFLSYRFWKEQLEGRQSVIGQTVQRRSGRAVIAGIVPKNVWFPSPSVDVYELSGDAFDSYSALLVRTRSAVVANRLETELNVAAAELGQALKLTEPHAICLRDVVRYPILLFVIGSLSAAGIVFFSTYRGWQQMKRTLGTSRQRSTPASIRLFLMTFIVLGSVFVSGLALFLSADQSVYERWGGPELLCFDILISAVALSSVYGKPRCCKCNRLLNLGSSIGSPTFSFLEWSGRELTCPKGHGFLCVPQHDTSWSEDYWIAMV